MRVRRLQKQFDTPSDKGKPVAMPGTQSLGFSLRSAQATEEERYRRKSFRRRTLVFPLEVCDAAL
jgi:hypothetical protein